MPQPTARSTARKPTTERALRGLIEEAKALVGSEWASFFLVDGTELCSTINSTGDQFRIPASSGIAGHVAATGEPLVVPDAYSDPRFNRSVDDATGMRTQNVMCAPLYAPGSTRDVVGVLQMVNKKNDVVGVAAGVGSNIAGNVSESGGLLGCLFKGCCHRPMVAPDDQPGFTGGDLEVLQDYASRAADALSAAAAKTAVVLEHVNACLDGWENDTLSLSEVTGGRPLSHLSEVVFDRLGLIERFRMDREKLVLFLRSLEAGYAPYTCPSVRYHNSAHVASVVAFSYALLQHGAAREVVARASTSDGQLEVLAIIFAAVVHDFEHKGLSNNFLVKTADERAVLYNDQHVNENHHVAAAFSLLRRPELNFLEHLTAPEYLRLRRLVIDMVLATDMADGVRILGDFKAAVDKSLDAQTLTLNEQTISLGLQVALKCSDLGHLALPWEGHLAWVRRLETEFFVQGDLEKDLGFEEITFLMDRSKPGVFQTQVGFFEFVVCPLFAALLRVFPGAAPMHANLMANYDRWKALEAQKAPEANT